MPSYTDEQKRRAVEAVEECGGSVTRAMRRLGYPTRQTLYHWLNRRDASHERRAGRPWSHYDPALKAQAVAFVRSVMAGKDVAEMLGVSSAAVVCNWARAAEGPSPAAADRGPIEPMGDSEDRAYDGFEGSLEERVRQLELENDILRAAAKVLKAEGPGPMANREKALAVNEPRATTGRSSKELTGSLRISKSSYEYQRQAISRPDRHAGLRARVREEESQVQLVQRRDIRCAREPGQPRLPSRGAQRAVAHRHHGVRAAGRQGVPVPDPRLLRRRPARLVDRHGPERGARQQQPRGRVRHPFQRAAPRRALRSRVPLPLARMDRDLREEPPDQVDVEEGVQPGRLGDGGILRQAQERVLPPSGLVGRDDARVLPNARRLSEILQRGAAEGEAGMAEPDAVPEEPWAGRIAGPKKRPHPLCV